MFLINSSLVWGGWASNLYRCRFPEAILTSIWKVFLKQYRPPQFQSSALSLSLSLLSYPLWLQAGPVLLFASGPIPRVLLFDGICALALQSLRYTNTYMHTPPPPHRKNTHATRTNTTTKCTSSLQTTTQQTHTLLNAYIWFCYYELRTSLVLYLNPAFPGNIICVSRLGLIVQVDLPPCYVDDMTCGDWLLMPLSSHG